MRRAGAIVGLAVVVVIAAGAGYLYWRASEKDRVIAEQQRVIVELGRKLERAWAAELVGDLRVHAVTQDPPAMDVTFYQYQPGTETPSFQRRMTLPGKELYIDALVVTFDRGLVEAGDATRGKSLLLFRRAFGDLQKPADGVPLFRAEGDSPVPEVAEVDARPGEFERKLWAGFWELANDPAKARAAGIRVAQGEAPHVEPAVGQVYKLTLRASGGLEITPRLPAAVTGQ